MGNPTTGVMFHSCSGERMDLNKLGQRIIRPAVEALRLDWYGWHGFRRSIASNLYELGANDKVVQRTLRHPKPTTARLACISQRPCPNLHGLGVSDKVIQQILRHANVTTTMNIYMKTVSLDAANAMKALEMMCATIVQPGRLEGSRVM